MKTLIAKSKGEAVAVEETVTEGKKPKAKAKAKAAAKNEAAPSAGPAGAPGPAVEDNTLCTANEGSAPKTRKKGAGQDAAAAAREALIAKLSGAAK